MESIVKIKTPGSCEECTLCVAVLGKHYCTPLGVHIRKAEKDCNCPLVAVPQKRDPVKDRGAYDTAYTHGWNGCIEAFGR